MRSAADFLARFRRADREGQLLGVLADDPDGFADALDSMPEALGAAMEQSVAPAHGAPVLLWQECFTSAACAPDGRIVTAGAHFASWFPDSQAVTATLRTARPGAQTATVLADDKNGRRVALAAGAAAATRLWPLDSNVRATLDAGHAAFAVVAFRPDDRAWRQAAHAFNLTQAEALLTASLARHGDLQRAAADRGVAYETARKFVASAMRKTGTRRQTDLIRETLKLAAGDLPDATHLALLARDLFGLTERQAALAVLIARGETRDQAAGALGISDHGAKADLRTIFLACGVQSAAELARSFAELNAVQGLATACDVTVTPRGKASEPLRLVPRAWAGGKIAISDHGPQDARPVIVFHSVTAARQQSRSMIAALQRSGFRPIAFERAGYGLSDPVAGDPNVTAARDLACILDTLGIARAALLARAATAITIACGAALGGRIAGGVLLVPETPAKLDRARSGLLGRTKAIFTDHPELAAAFARMLSRRTSAAAIEHFYRAAMRGQKPDQAALNDPGEMADMVRSSQQCAAGMHGFLAETLAHARRAAPPSLPDARRWSLHYGGHDKVFDIADARAIWAEALPGAAVTLIPDAGRLLHITHAAVVVEALRRCFEEPGS